MKKNIKTLKSEIKESSNQSSIENADKFISSEMSGENFVKNDRVYILGSFDDSISQRVIPEFVSLIEKKRTERFAQIEIFINSYGGYGHVLLSLLSVISIAKMWGIKIITYNLGAAHSCGSILFIHGDTRRMFKYATSVMHLGCNGEHWTTFEQLDRVTVTSKKWFNTIVEWYANNTRMKKSQIIKVLKDDKFSMDAKQCLKYGFCDEIIG